VVLKKGWKWKKGRGWRRCHQDVGFGWARGRNWIKRWGQEWKRGGKEEAIEMNKMKKEKGCKRVGMKQG
jgi:hypothetical protein